MPSVNLVLDPTGPAFPITEDCTMPAIRVTANVVGVTPDPKVPLSYQWNVTLVFVGGACAHSLNRRISHREINATTQTNTFTIPFSQIRGGELTVSVTVRVGNVLLNARSEKLQVVGTDPSTAALMVITNDAFKKLMRLESGLRRFRTASSSLFSGDNLGGVGICQITSPSATDDQVWSWKEDLKAGLLFYKAKEVVARAYPPGAFTNTESKLMLPGCLSSMWMREATRVPRCGK
jgi:hypothetical protein